MNQDRKLFARMPAAAVLAAAALLALAATPSFALVEVGQEAPDFTLTDSKAVQVTLSAQRGKYVVLEWLNHGCPYVKKHYKTQNMQGLQKKYTEKGVVWYSIISSAPGNQGYSEPDQANTDATSHGAHPTSILLDPTGNVGRLYGAKTTPHMFVIDPAGRVVYMGAIDDQPTFLTWGMGEAQNYVVAALEASMAGQPVAVPATKPYGCSVKY